MNLYNNEAVTISINPEYLGNGKYVAHLPQTALNMDGSWEVALQSAAIGPVSCAAVADRYWCSIDGRHVPIVKDFRNVHELVGEINTYLHASIRTVFEASDSESEIESEDSGVDVTAGPPLVRKDLEVTPNGLRLYINNREVSNDKILLSRTLYTLFDFSAHRNTYDPKMGNGLIHILCPDLLTDVGIVSSYGRAPLLAVLNSGGDGTFHTINSNMYKPMRVNTLPPILHFEICNRNMQPVSASPCHFCITLRKTRFIL